MKLTEDLQTHMELQMLSQIDEHVSLFLCCKGIGVRFLAQDLSMLFRMGILSLPCANLKRQASMEYKKQYDYQSLHQEGKGNNFKRLFKKKIHVNIFYSF